MNSEEGSPGGFAISHHGPVLAAWMVVSVLAEEGVLYAEIGPEMDLEQWGPH